AKEEIEKRVERCLNKIPRRACYDYSGHADGCEQNALQSPLRLFSTNGVCKARKPRHEVVQNGHARNPSGERIAPLRKGRVGASDENLRDEEEGRDHEEDGRDAEK